MAANMQENLNKALDVIEKKTDHIELVKQASEATGLRGAYVVIAASLSVLAFVFFGFGAGFLVNAVGVAYPAYMSFKALETKEDPEDDKQWLTYWVVFSAFTVLETFIEFIMYFIPFYYVLKLAFIVALMMPGNYAKTLYVKIIQPILKNNEVFIDSSLHKAKASGAEALEAAADLAATGAAAALKTEAGQAAVSKVAAAAVSAATDSASPPVDADDVAGEECEEPKKDQ